MLIEFKRNCPRCHKEIVYKFKSSMDKANLNITLCKRCSNQIKENDIYKCWVKRYGKDVADEKMIEYGKKMSIAQHNVSPEKNKKKANSGSKNPMYGRSVYSVWIEKYGINEADKRLKSRGEKFSLSMSGENNPMYGKPAPKGSGRGWSGWYKGHFFRSKMELSYLKYLLDNNIKFENGESIKFRMSYVDDNGKNRNYYPDFYLIESEEIIEIKPTSMISFENNSKKFKVATERHKNKFKILSYKDFHQLTKKEIRKLYNDKDLVWIERYDKKYQEEINATNNN